MGTAVEQIQDEGKQRRAMIRKFEAGDKAKKQFGKKMKEQLRRSSKKWKM